MRFLLLLPVVLATARGQCGDVIPTSPWVPYFYDPDTQDGSAFGVCLQATWTEIWVNAGGQTKSTVSNHAAEISAGTQGVLWLIASAVGSGLLTIFFGSGWPFLSLLGLLPVGVFGIAIYALQYQKDHRLLWPALAVQATQALACLTGGICLFLYSMNTSEDPGLKGKHFLLLLGVGGLAVGLALQLYLFYLLYRGYRWLEAQSETESSVPERT